MARRTKTDQILDSLSAYLGDNAAVPDSGLVERYLSHRSHVVVARAASIAGAHGMAGLSGALSAAFERLLGNGEKNDKGCVGKRAIVKALDRLGYDDLSWFRAALGCVQMEPAYGGMIDTAIDVRCRAARALGRFPWRSVSRSLVILTGDRAPKVRMSAIDMLASYDTPEAELAVLAKTVAGDGSEEVMGVCFRALLAFESSENLALVASYLREGADQVRIEAAFAIAESRAPDAFERLREVWDQTPAVDMRRSLLLAITTIRSEAVKEFLLRLRSDRRFEQVCREALAGYGEG